MPISSGQKAQAEKTKVAPFVFDKILADGIRQGKFPAKSKNAIQWYRDKAKNATISSQNIISEARTGKRDKADVRPGVMFFFQYDPKLKAELPFYDTFPCIFCVDLHADGFLGLNLHYLPYPLRAKLMDALYKISSDTRYTPQTVLKLSYGLLRGASQMKLFAPCLKKYLYKHVRTKMIEIYPTEWDVALFLPVASFQKASQSDVWKWSVSQI